MAKISNLNEISAYLHCKLCLDEWKSNPKIKTKMSPGQYADVQAGWTKQGIQLWCKRHDCNIVHIDFEGQQHLSNSTRHNSTSTTTSVKKE